MRAKALLFALFSLLLAAAGTVAYLVWWPHGAPSIYDQGVAQVRRGDFEQGKKDLDAAVAANPYNADAYYWMGVAWQGLGKNEQAADSFSKALAVEAEIPSVGGPKTAVPIQRDLAAVWARRGAARLALGRYDAAIQDLTRAINSTRNNAKAYCKRGLAYFHGGFPEIAKDDLLEAVLLDPNDVEALLGHARVSLALGDSLRAIKDARQAIRIRADSAEGYEIMASGYLQKGEFSPVLESFRKLTLLDPAAAARLNREWAQAAPTFRPVQRGMARKLLLGSAGPAPPGSKGPAAKAAEARVRQGLACRGKGQWDEAVAQFTAALKLDGDCTAAYYGRGVTLIDQGFPDTAVKDLGQALALRPDDAEAWCQRGRAWLALDGARLAVDDCTEALRRKPVFAEAHHCRGLAYLRNQEYTRALADLKEAARLDASLAAAIKPAEAEALRGRGLENLRRKQWDAAVADLTGAIMLKADYGGEPNPRLAEAYRGRGLERAGRRKPAQALDDLNKAIELDDGCAESFEARGGVYLKAMSWQGAIDDFSRAIALDPRRGFRLRPELAQAYYGRGLKEQQAGRPTEAQADFDRAEKHGWQSL